jgi:hypothetical protein
MYEKALSTPIPNNHIPIRDYILDILIFFLPCYFISLIFILYNLAFKKDSGLIP